MTHTVESINALIDKLEPGESLRLEDVPAPIYHATMGDGSTMIKLANQAPIKYRNAKDNPQHNSTPAMMIGSAFHSKVLEPDKFVDEFAVYSGTSRRNKGYTQLCEDYPDHTILLESELNLVEGMAVSCRYEFADYLADGVAEVSYWKRHEETGLIIKARLDYERGDFALDLKSTAEASEDAIHRSIISYGYHIQHALYLEVTGISDMVFLFTESKKPYICTGPVYFNDEVAELGRLEVRLTLQNLKHQIDMDIWTGYHTGPLMMDLKPWELRRLEELRELFDDE